MTDRLEHDLTTLFDDRATAIDAPPVPLDQLVRDGEVAVAAHRRRTRMVAVAAVAAAVLLAATIPWALRGQDDSTPEPTEVPTVNNTSTERPASVDDLPEGPIPAAPYVLDGVLHLDGEEYRVPTRNSLEFTAATGSTALFTQMSGRTMTSLGRPWVLRDGDLVPLNDDEHTYLGSPLLSPDGTVVAAFTSRGQSVRIRAFDVNTGGEIASTDGQATTMAGIDGRGRIYWSGRDGAFVWTPGERPQRLRIAGPWKLLDVRGDRVLVRSRSVVRLGTVSARGRLELAPRRLTGFFERAQGVRVVRERWSRDGRLRVAQGRRDRSVAVVTDVTSGERTRLLVPDDVVEVLRVGKELGENDAGQVAFEGNQNVIVPAQTRDGQFRFLRCSVRSGACDRVPLEGHPDNGGPQFAKQ